MQQADDFFNVLSQVDGPAWFGDAAGAGLMGAARLGRFVFGGSKVFKAVSSWPVASGGKLIINGIEYSNHALERMQPIRTILRNGFSYSRGVPLSAVENAIKYGTVSSGNVPSAVIRTFENVRVVTNPAGTQVITVIKIGN